MLDRLAQALLSSAEFAPWQIVRDYRVRHIVVLGSPETPEDRLHSEAVALMQQIVRRTVAAAQDCRYHVLGVSADNPIADRQRVPPDALVRAVEEDIANIDLDGRRRLRGGRPLMIDLDIQPPSAREGVPSGTGAKTGGEGRRRNAQDAALQRNRIEAVLAAAKARWPDRRKRPATTVMVKELDRLKRTQGFAPDTLRKILAGKYAPATRLGINPDW